MSVQFHDVIGTIGVACIILMYFLLQLGRIRSDQLNFPLWNGIGASLILISLTFEFNLSAFLIEFFWLLISIFGVVTFARRRRLSQMQDPDE